MCTIGLWQPNRRREQPWLGARAQLVRRAGGGREDVAARDRKFAPIRSRPSPTRPTPSHRSAGRKSAERELCRQKSRFATKVVGLGARGQLPITNRAGATAGLSSSGRRVPASHCWASQQWHPSRITMVRPPPSSITPPNRGIFDAKNRVSRHNSPRPA
jgi:hypothetical protein